MSTDLDHTRAAADRIKVDGIIGWMPYMVLFNGGLVAMGKTMYAEWDTCLNVCLDHCQKIGKNKFIVGPYAGQQIDKVVRS